MKKYIALIILAWAAVASADRYEFVSNVNRWIPDVDSIGIRDTIFIDQHIMIEDINFYVGVGQPGQTWAEVSLLSNSLRSCDSTTTQWQFSYHAVCYFKEYLRDASMGLFRNQIDYGDWWRFYVYPRSFTGPYLDDEPPTIQPVYYDWSNLIPEWPNNVLPLPPWGHETGLCHPDTCPGGKYDKF
jgi:hypothetical protein